MNPSVCKRRDWVEALTSRGPEQKQALTELRDILMRMLRRMKYRLPPVDDALLEDSVQDALLLILGRLDQFEGRSRFLTWATSIAIHAAISNIRKQRYKDVSMQDVISDLDASFSVQSEAEQDRDRDTIIGCLNDLIQEQLTERQRMVLLAELKGVPQETIAGWLNSNRNAIYKLTHDARKKLRKGLESAGYRASDINAVFSR